MATKAKYTWSDETLDARLAEAKNAAYQREMDLFRASELTPPDVNQENVDAARSEAERTRKLADELQKERDARASE